MAQAVATYDMKELELEVRRVKIRFMQARNTTFFSALLANLDLRITEDGCSTACTNGIYLKLNPYFIQPLDLQQLMGLILHEVLHVAYDHIIRCADAKLNPKLYNIAADHYINLIILGMGYKLPEGGYYDTKYKNMSTMQIYRELEKNPPPKSELDKYKVDLMPRPKDMSEQEHTHVVEGILVKACIQAQLARDAGSIPGDLKRKLDKILNPVLPWQTILQNYMQPYSKDDYSWSRPNRRYIPEFYLPHMKSENLKQLTAGIDVSLSMKIKDLEAIVPEVKYIWETMKPEKLRLHTFDTKVHLDKLYSEGDELDLVELKGGGGTNVTPLLQTIRKEHPEVAIIFTDGYFPNPDMSNIDSNIIWVIKDNPNFTNPVGEIIHLTGGY